MSIAFEEGRDAVVDLAFWEGGWSVGRGAVGVLDLNG